MSIQEGKKIVSALEAFNARKIFQTDVTSLLSVALRSGGIEPRHIKRLHAALEREVEALPANFGVLPPLGNKSAKYMAYGHMEINRDIDGTHDYDQYTPVMVGYSIAKHAFLRNQTLLPVSFNAQHTAFRFIQRTCNVLDYQSDAFFDSVVFATNMMQAISKNGPLPSPVPMFVPHEEGLFLGFGEAMPEDTYRRQTDHAERRGKRVAISHYGADKKTQPYMPTSRIVVQTFLSKDDMNPAKRAVWELLSGLMADPELQPAIHKSLSCQIVGNYDVTPDMAKKMEAMHTTFREAAESPEWSRVARNTWQNGHVPRMGYADRLQRYGVAQAASRNPVGP